MSRLDPLSILLQYVLDVKPYHTKIYEVNLKYTYTDTVGITILDHNTMDIRDDINYWNDYCQYNGWDIPSWGGFWKPGGFLNENIVEIDTGAQFFSILGNQTDFFALDQYERGFIPILLYSVDIGTNTFTMTTDIPWITGDDVLIESSLGIIPAPLVNGTTYYVIKTGARTFKLATSHLNAIGNVSIDLTAMGVGIMQVRLRRYTVDVLGPSPTTFTVDHIGYNVGDNRTRIYTVESLSGFAGGYVPVYAQSNWDNPYECFDPVTGLPTAGETTVAVTISEELLFDFSNIQLFDAVGVGQSTFDASLTWDTPMPRGIPGSPYSWGIHAFGWNDSDILTETTITETLQITVDPTTGGMPLIGAWDGNGWDFTVWNEDISSPIPYYESDS